MPGRGKRGYVLDVQADLLSQLATRVVVPLLPLVVAPLPIRGSIRFSRLGEGRT